MRAGLHRNYDIESADTCSIKDLSLWVFQIQRRERPDRLDACAKNTHLSLKVSSGQIDILPDNFLQESMIAAAFRSIR